MLYFAVLWTPVQCLLVSDMMMIIQSSKLYAFMYMHMNPDINIVGY